MGPAVLWVALLAATMMVAAGTSQADRGGRDSGGGWRAKDGGERSRASIVQRQSRGDRAMRAPRADRVRGGGDVRYRSPGGGTRGGGNDRAWRGGGDVRYKSPGGRTWGGGNDRTWGGGVRTRYRGGEWRAYGGGGGRADHGGRRVYVSTPRYRGGAGYYYGGTWYRSPVDYRYAGPRVHVTLGFGMPWCYCPPAYRRVVVSRPVVVEEVYEIDVDNLPPDGCYYYDPFCDREYPDLDTYTEHVDHEGHAGTIEIRYLDSGDYVRTLEFVGGFWIVQR
jgi:hypothetical protein